MRLALCVGGTHMPKRLIEMYRIGDNVEITFEGRIWKPAVVIDPVDPGVWVKTRDGHEWFVVQSKAIRRAQSGENGGTPNGQV